MPTISQAITDYTTRLEQAGVDAPRLDARLLVQHALQCVHEDIIRDSDKPLSDEQALAIQSLMQRRLNREPLSHIVGYRNFWKHRFIVTSDVLDPRPDSETLIEAALEYAPYRSEIKRIIEFGVGSGCLILSLLSEYQEAEGIGIDISEAALKIARKNAEQLHLQSRTQFLCSNWAKTLQTDCDMIISNPPYIAENDLDQLLPEVKAYEPEWALSGGVDGLAAYRELMPHIRRCLKRGGIAILELGAQQAEPVLVIAKDEGLVLKALRCDLGGIERALVLTH